MKENKIYEILIIYDFLHCTKFIYGRNSIYRKVLFNHKYFKLRSITQNYFITTHFYYLYIDFMTINGDNYN